MSAHNKLNELLYHDPPKKRGGDIDLNGDIIPGQTTIEGRELRPLTAQERSFWPPCCDKALREWPHSCVCATLTVCPEHGRRHNGTHD